MYSWSPSRVRNGELDIKTNVAVVKKIQGADAWFRVEGNPRSLCGSEFVAANFKLPAHNISLSLESGNRLVRLLGGATHFGRRTDVFLRHLRLWQGLFERGREPRCWLLGLPRLGNPVCRRGIDLAGYPLADVKTRFQA